MSADEVRGPRHAAPKKPLFTRFHVPSGKAIALAAMPTAVLMGMGFTPTLALADGNDGTPTANSLTVDEYQACLEVVEDAKKDDASASPTPSASASESASSDGEPSAETSEEQKAPEADKGTDKETSSSSDSGSDDKDEPAPATSAPAAEDTTEPEPEPSETDRNLLEGLGDAFKDVFTPKEKEAEASPTPSASATEDDEAGDAAGTAKETTEKVTETAKDTAEDAGDKATKAAEDTKKTVEEATEEATETPEATASPSPSESAKIDPEDCPIATDAEGGVDNQLLLPDDPWTLNASSLLLKGASYEGIVEVRTASGGTKRVLKYVISGGTDIGDLHQTVEDKRSGATHHVQAAKGSTSTIRDGDTVMYTESISGNLLGLIPVTFDPEHPPPLDIPLIYFTKVTVKQAGQFGGTLHVPGLQQYITTG
ncbi:hypothetical protein [Streptomyces sp. CB02400]|uniref:hypothetical protein n=1 Tax=Streptomyces sp. CB02400 TaxID=1703944 RepID=UPI000939302A|nr:hypothetical protein [Streptomyces sp. CB02400]OKK11880.1 hypothetical protein AMK33_10470 [Streptomyces sp. CB02400]